MKDELIEFFINWAMAYLFLSSAAFLFFCIDIVASESKREKSVCQTQNRRLAQFFVPARISACWLLEKP